MNRKYWYFGPLAIALALALVVGGYSLGRRSATPLPPRLETSAPAASGGEPSKVSTSSQQNIPDSSKTGWSQLVGVGNPPGKDHQSQDSISDRPPSPGARETVVAGGVRSRFEDLPEVDRPRERPQAVGNKVRVRQNLRPDRTYETMTRGTVCSTGIDRHWGLTSTASINYAFEARIDREIVTNDGEVIVERRHFRDVKSLKLDVELQDVRFDIKQIHAPILALATLIWPEQALTARTFDGLSLTPVLGLLRSFGIRPEQLTGHDREAIKVFTQFDSLQGKSVEVEYRDGQGVTQVVPILGAMTRSERFLHYHGVLVSDSLIFPNPDVAEGESWQVEGSNFSNLIDPGLRASVSGEITMSRAKNLVVSGRPMAILKTLAGRLVLTSSESKGGEIGWFEPKGTMRFSPEDQIIVEASLSGRGELKQVGPTHLLFKTEMQQSPQITAFYTCRMLDTPSKGER